jgi:hypothetical protein
MSIRDAIAWLFDVGDESEADALEADALKDGPARARREPTRPRESLERQLYGQAEAIRVLYQFTVREERPAKPPRPKRGRGLWVARYVESLSSSLPDPVAAKA